MTRGAGEACTISPYKYSYIQLEPEQPINNSSHFTKRSSYNIALLILSKSHKSNSSKMGHEEKVVKNTLSNTCKLHQIFF